MRSIKFLSLLTPTSSCILPTRSIGKQFLVFLSAFQCRVFNVVFSSRMDGEGKHPPPFTPITEKDINEKKWVSLIIEHFGILSVFHESS